MKIYAPVKDFNGWRNNVRFVNGVGETNDSRLIEWFRSHGYKVPIEDGVEPVAAIGKNIDDSWFVDLNKLADEPNFEEMTPNELREWAKANGRGMLIKNIRSKEKLLEIVRG